MIFAPKKFGYEFGFFIMPSMVWRERLPFDHQAGKVFHGNTTSGRLLRNSTASRPVMCSAGIRAMDEREGELDGMDNCGIGAGSGSGDRRGGLYHHEKMNQQTVSDPG